MIGAAFGLQPGDPDYEELRIGFLAHYAAALAVDSTLFDGIPALLDDLRQRNLGWGVVTNKAAKFTDPLVAQIGLADADCVISGDTTAHSKPHPEPLLEAARRLNLQPQECWYVGDDLRDIQAGRAAGMATVAVAWGYCGESAPHTWEADALIETPLQLLALLPRH
jgi:phosphoglycolate phosphatase